MTGDDLDRPSSEVSALARGIRLDLVIAVCALLVSSLATAASWWQTRVIQQQLSAQVWPYVSTGYGINNDVVQINVENDGLGPAIIRSAYIDVMHAIVGPNMIRRKPRGETMGLEEQTLRHALLTRPRARRDHAHLLLRDRARVVLDQRLDEARPAAGPELSRYSQRLTPPIIGR